MVRLPGTDRPFGMAYFQESVIDLLCLHRNPRITDLRTRVHRNLHRDDDRFLRDGNGWQVFQDDRTRKVVAIVWNHVNLVLVWMDDAGSPQSVQNSSAI